MFRIGSSKPIEMKPNSYINKIKSIAPLKNKYGDEKLLALEEEEEKEEKKTEEEKKPKKKEKKKEAEIDTSKYIEAEIDELVENKLREYLKKHNKKEKKEEKEPQTSKEYTELKEIIETKLSKMDEIADYIKSQKQKSLTEEIFSKPIIKEVIKEVPKEVVKEVIKEVPKEVIKEVPKEVIKEVIKEVPKEVIKEVPVEKTLGKKRKKYDKLTDEEYEEFKKKNENTEYKKEDLFKSGDEYYANVKGRKKLIK